MKKFFIVITSVLIIFLILILFIEKKESNLRNKALPYTDKLIGIHEEIIDTLDGHRVLVDKPKGYSVAFPKDMQFDLSLSPEQIKAYNDNLTVIVTREWSPYLDRWYYIDNYLNNYYLNDNYIKSNNITIRRNEKSIQKGAEKQVISISRTPKSQNIKRQNEYTYFYIMSTTGEQAFFRIMFKCYDYKKCKPLIDEIIASFEELKVEGNNSFSTDFKPKPNSKWNKETKNLYKKICNSDKTHWGVFIDGAYQKKEKYEKLQQLEKELDFEFDFSLHYVLLGWEFPTDKMEKFYKDGKITELTLQVSYFNNDHLFGENINLNMYDGQVDESIRKFARGAKKFGHPFLFRINNEMNSDWVNYSGVAALSDPEIFIENWRRIYNIFDEEGVDNAIWIFNPNAEDCPPAHWNSYISYFPGSEYVHMIGMTGYNTGEYYKDVYNEKWRTFDEIYKEPYEKYINVFGKYPFIITEFASSSVGGDKAQWITDMFKSIKKYKNIKMALWWSHADFDMRPEFYKNIARPYFIDETPKTTHAFKNGIKEYK